MPSMSFIDHRTRHMLVEIASAEYSVHRVVKWPLWSGKHRVKKLHLSQYSVDLLCRERLANDL